YPPAWESGELSMWELLLNSKNTLKFMVPFFIRKDVSKWINKSCKVISHKVYKSNKGNYGSKLIEYKKNFIVKEQRVLSSRCFNLKHLRCTLISFERNYQIKTLSNQIINKRFYSLNVELSSSNKSILHPWFVTGFIDAEGSFMVVVRKSSKYRSMLKDYLLVLVRKNLKINVKKQITNKLYYSSVVKPDSNNKLILKPWYITGLIDAEGSFIISIIKNPRCKTGWEVQTMFSISLHKKDYTILELIKSYFEGRGSINKERQDSLHYRVKALLDLTNVIIPHFEKYPLITQKRADFELFKQIVFMLNNKEHLTSEGLAKIVSIRSSLNKGLSPLLMENFPNIVPIERPKFETPKTFYPDWIAGFASGEACFMIKFYKSSNYRLNELASLNFYITQHIRDKQLLLNLVKYLNCGIVFKHSENAVVFKVSKFSDITQKIIPFFF
uniref:hypothetical protein n=1 Tax=Drechslerella dactyloides TaxID=74499 RepID=UPI0022FD92F1